MPLAATARYQAPSSCTKSTIGGAPRFVQVRPFAISRLNRGTTETLRFLFDFIPVWLVCVLSFILGLPSFGSSVAFSAATSIATIGSYISYGTQFQLPNLLLLLTNHLYPSDRNSHCPTRHIRGAICARTIPSRQALVPDLGCRGALDRIYLGRVLPPGAQPC